MGLNLSFLGEAIKPEHKLSPLILAACNVRAFVDFDYFCSTNQNIKMR